MWEGEFLAKWMVVAIILSVTSSLTLYSVETDKKRKRLDKISKDENKRVLQNLYLDLKDTLETFEEKQTLKLTDKKVSFVNRLWNHDTYDGLVLSAKLSLLRLDLQQPIQTAFRQIKLHNQYLDRVLELQSTGRTNLSRYYEILEDCEAHLKVEIPKLMVELKKVWTSIRL